MKLWCHLIRNVEEKGPHLPAHILERRCMLTELKRLEHTTIISKFMFVKFNQRVLFMCPKEKCTTVGHGMWCVWNFHWVSVQPWKCSCRSLHHENFPRKFNMKANASLNLTLNVIHLWSLEPYFIQCYTFLSVPTICTQCIRMENKTIVLYGKERKKSRLLAFCFRVSNAPWLWSTMFISSMFLSSRQKPNVPTE